MDVASQGVGRLRGMGRLRGAWARPPHAERGTALQFNGKVVAKDADRPWP